MDRDYQQAQQAYAMQELSQAGVAADSRITTIIRQRAHKHAEELAELAGNVKVVADQLFGMESNGVNAPMETQAAPPQIEPIRPQFDAIEREQYMINEAIDTLRRQLARFGNI